jgi:hypothetical protein
VLQTDALPTELHHLDTLKGKGKGIAFQIFCSCRL